MKEINDLRRTIDLAKQAVDLTRQNHPDLTIRLCLLGDARALLYERFQDSADLEAASSCFQDAWNIQTAAPFDRISAAARGLQLLIMQRRFDVAIELGKDIIEIFPTVNTKLLNRDDQQFVVSMFAGIAADMCAIFLETNQPLEALEYLERGRCFILGQLLDARSDLSSLRKVNPNIATRYQMFLDMINAPLQQSKQDLFEEQNAARSQALAQMEQCILEIRAIAGHERFLLGQTTEEMQRCAIGGTIVLVNLTEIRSDAILVSSSAIKTVNLPNMKASEAKNWLSKKWKYRRGEIGQKNKEYAEYLAWLWEVCVKEIVQEVCVGKKPADCLPRIWWIGSKLASSMPFHAAGKLTNNSITSTENALDMVISSYTPSIRALAYSQRRTQSIKGVKASLMLVTMPTTPGEKPLPKIVKEQDMIKGLKQSKGMEINHLDAPSVDKVLHGMEECGIAHFACHGSANPQDPSYSGLILQKSEDGQMKQDWLTVRHISNLNLRNARVAYLSACSTAENKVAQLGDEVIHVASGFQVAGFPHVIGCLWPSNDNVCLEIARRFYSYLLNEGSTEWDDRMVACAVRDAVLDVRSREAYRNMPRYWAPFVHYGA